MPLDNSKKFFVWCVVTCVYISTLALWLPGAFLALDSYGLLGRITFCVAMISPAGVLMGFAFPTGMRMISAVDRKPTPWFWGVNGAAGVLAGVAAIAGNIAFGINSTLIAAGLCYLALAPAGLAIGFRPTRHSPVE